MPKSDKTDSVDIKAPHSHSIQIISTIVKKDIDDLKAFFFSGKDIGHCDKS